MVSINRFYAFWWYCIPIRIAIGALATYLTLLEQDYPFWSVGIYATLTASGFLINSVLTWMRLKRRGGLGGHIWWNRVRVVHIFLWGLCAALSFSKVRGAGSLLLIDAVVGIVSGILHFSFGKTL